MVLVCELSLRQAREDVHHNLYKEIPSPPQVTNVGISWCGDVWEHTTLIQLILCHLREHC